MRGGSWLNRSNRILAEDKAGGSGLMWGLVEDGGGQETPLDISSDQILGWGICSHWLSRVLTKTGFYKEGHSWVRSLAKVRSSQESLSRMNEGSRGHQEQGCRQVRFELCSVQPN